MNIVSKADLIVWKKGGAASLLDKLHVPETAQHWMGVEATVDVPTVPSAKSASGEAVVLLQVAAEVEHALLLQYLFAAYSLNATAPPEWGTKLLNIARQEMAHLITVQNLLRALKAPVHFDREDFPLHPSLYPFPVVLEPLSQVSLAKYVAAEMPLLDTIDAAVQSHVAEILKIADVAAHQDVQRVGRIYSHLYWLFRGSDAAEPGEPWVGFTADPNYSQWHIQAGDFASTAAVADFSTPDEWGLSDDDGSGMHVDATLPRLSALNAIFTIAAQGEGSATQKDSHFDQFLKLYDAFAAFEGSAVLPVATNPATGSQPIGGGAIMEPTARLLAQLLDVRYEMLLLCLMLGVTEPKAGPTDTRANLLGWAVTEMKDRIGLLARKLATMPLSAEAPTNAGAPFELLHGPLPQDARGQWARLKQMIQESDELLTSLGGVATDVLGTATLDDAATRTLVDSHLGD